MPRHLRTWWSASTWGFARWQLAVTAVVVAIFVGFQGHIDAAVGLDPSWQAGLALARIHHLAWGRDIIFTFGPLGFLQNSAFYCYSQSVLATLYQVAIVAALFLGVAVVLRGRHSPTTSLVGAFVTTGLTTAILAGVGFAAGGTLGVMYPELTVLAALVWASLPFLRCPAKPSMVFATCTMLGVVAGFQMLVKLNTGPAILAIALAMSALVGWKNIWRHCATVTAFAASIPVWWLLAGQHLGDLPTWLRASLALASGYGEAMAVPVPPYPIPAVVVSFASVGALCFAFIRGVPEIPRRFVVLVGIATMITLKGAFGRFEPWHFSLVLGLIVVVVAITPLTGNRYCVLAVAAALAIAWVSTSDGIPALLQRAATDLRAPVQGVTRLITLAQPGDVHRRAEQNKAHQRELYAIPERFLRTIGSQSVHIDPNESSAAWAYDLAWHPAPVFATYAAYTPALDGLNGESLANGPQFVLSRLSPASPATDIDGRLATQESPRYSRTLLCNYTVSGIDNRWALFTRNGPHCGALVKRSEVTVHGADMVPVPAPSGPDMAVLVGIDLDRTLTDRLFQGDVYPLFTSTVTLDNVTYRLISGNAAEPFLITTPAWVHGTNLQIRTHSIGLGHTAGIYASGIRARLRFYEMRVGL
ncbi:hypothetical protein H7I01_00700 [Mycobacterium palustre]|nr:hypothetical protein [Mycobacterium palustre]